MRFFALAFLVLALVSGALGFGGVSGIAAGAAQALFFVFLVLLVVFGLAWALRAPSTVDPESPEPPPAKGPPSTKSKSDRDPQARISATPTKGRLGSETIDP